MNKLGTEYGGWIIPNNINLNDNSIIYSAGVGEDISFDLLLQNKYNSNIFLIDPTNRSLKHYNEIIKYYETNNWVFTGDIQKDYKQHIEQLNVNFSNIHYVNKGLWSENTVLKFYKQHNTQYVSQSLINNMFGDEYDIVNVTSIKDIMDTYGHTRIDLLKMDIEGAEIKVLNNILDNNIFPKYLCIEFDLYLKNKDSTN